MSATKLAPPVEFSPLEQVSNTPLKKNTTEEQELWLIRIPEGLNPSLLDGVTIDLSQANQNLTERIPTTVKTSDNRQYRAYLSSEKPPEDEPSLILSENYPQHFDGAQEMRDLKFMVPTSDRSAIELDEHPVDRFVSLLEVVSIPDYSSRARKIATRSRKRPTQPSGMKFRFKPYGFGLGKYIARS
ncbi:hypothetical protein IWQ61_006866 [Dispira simplex]|nr:hypothetical protein IWQ61_006866 [Dispira simplex]